LPRLKKFSAGAICNGRDAAPVPLNEAALPPGAARRLVSCWQ
jgi:hypothetical protein